MFIGIENIVIAINENPQAIKLFRKLRSDLHMIEQELVENSEQLLDYLKRANTVESPAEFKENSVCFERRKGIIQNNFIGALRKP